MRHPEDLNSPALGSQQSPPAGATYMLPLRSSCTADLMIGHVFTQTSGDTNMIHLIISHFRDIPVWSLLLFAWLPCPVTIHQHMVVLIFHDIMNRCWLVVSCEIPLLISWLHLSHTNPSNLSKCSSSRPGVAIWGKSGAGEATHSRSIA